MQNLHRELQKELIVLSSVKRCFTSGKTMSFMGHCIEKGILFYFAFLNSFLFNAYLISFSFLGLE